MDEVVKFSLSNRSKSVGKIGKNNPYRRLGHRGFNPWSRRDYGKWIEMKDIPFRNALHATYVMSTWLVGMGWELDHVSDPVGSVYLKWSRFEKSVALRLSDHIYKPVGNNITHWFGPEVVFDGTENFMVAKAKVKEAILKYPSLVKF